MDASLHDEVLEALWMQEESGKELVAENIILDQPSPSVPDLLAEMHKVDLVAIEGSSVHFTDRGRERARELIRSHRLAERLLTDVLAVGKENIERQACSMEHLLSPEVTNSICTLLGHPPVCPHGLVIPPGVCCKSHSTRIESIVSPLRDFKPGETGRITYIEEQDHVRRDRLASFGLVPGAVVRIHEREPSFVIRTDKSQIAIDPEIADHIFLRKI